MLQEGLGVDTIIDPIDISGYVAQFLAAFAVLYLPRSLTDSLTRLSPSNCLSHTGTNG